MRILHLIPSYSPAILANGVIGPMHVLNKELAGKGVEVTVYTTNLDGNKTLDVPLSQEVILDNVKVTYFPITYKPWCYSAALHGSLIHNLKKFDLIHISSVFLSVSTLGGYYAKKFNKPYIISPHGSLMQKPLQHHHLKKKIYLNLIEKRNLSGASALHFTGEKEKEEYLAAGLPFKKVLTLPYSFDTEGFIKDEIPPGIFREKFQIGRNKKIILFLGRISWKKGLDTLIPAFAQVLEKEPEAILVIAGPDDEGYARKIKFQISNLKLDGKVIFPGTLLGDDRLAAYQEADVFVLPSYSENFGMAVAEAMYLKLPVVVTDRVGIADEVQHSEAGLVVEKEPNQVTNAILNILSNPDLAKKMGERGRALIIKQFSCDKIAESFIKEYKTL